jgi:hypothetical protein
MAENQKVSCSKCGAADFEYDSYWKEYSCKKCGWLVQDAERISLLNKKETIMHEDIEKDIYNETAQLKKAQTESSNDEPTQASLIEQGSDVLIDAARPNLYQINAFRVMSLNVDASPRDVSRQAEKLKIIEKLGNAKAQVGRILPLDTEPDADAVRQAVQRLHDPERRLVDELFWIWPHKLGSCATDEALISMEHGDEKKAVDIWNIQKNSQSNSNVSIHNLAVLFHARALDLEHAARTKPLTGEPTRQRDDYWRSAFKHWIVLLDHEGFWSQVTARIRVFGDPRLTVSTARRMRAVLPLALLMINARLAVAAAEQGNMAEAKRHLHIMNNSGITASAEKEALSLAIGPIRERIKILCKAAEPDADADPANADKVIRQLIDQTKPLLSVLDCLLPADSPARDGAYDEVALRALACQIPFGNKTENWKVCLELLNLMSPLAASESARGRIEENMKIVQQNLEYDTCWFCRERRKQDSASIEVKMHGEVTRTPIYQGTNIQWLTRTIKVPRCGPCKAAHVRSGNYIGGGLALGLVAGISGCAAVNSSPGNEGIGFLIFLLCVIGVPCVGGMLAKKSAPSGLKPESEKTNYPLIKDLRERGWAIGEKPEGVQ